MYEYGEGVPKDRVKAMEWYKKAADQGYANAMKHYFKNKSCKPILSMRRSQPGPTGCSNELGIFLSECECTELTHVRKFMNFCSSITFLYYM